MNWRGGGSHQATSKGWPVGMIVPAQDSTPFSPFAPTEWEAALRTLAGQGHAVVELAITDPSSLDRQAVDGALSSSGVRLVSLTTGQAVAKEGMSLSSPEDQLRERAVERIVGHMNFAEAHGAVVIVGLLRGAEGDLGLLKESLRACAASVPDVRLALEPLNRYESSLVNTVAEALDLVERVGKENLGVLFDTFHANIEERSLESAILAAGERLFHVHVADSNRWPPGYGHIEFARVWDSLDRCRYRGGLVLECLLRPDREAVVRLASELQGQWRWKS